MIKRYYFMHARKPHKDGSGLYTYQYSVFSRRSWLPQVEKAFQQQLDYIESELKEAPGDKIEVLAFNRC